MKISKNSKILSVADHDPDGCVSQIVLSNTFNNIECMNVTYSTVDEMMKKIDYKQYDYVILTDITPNDISLLDLSDNIILIDHHDSAIEKGLHCPEKMRHVVTGHCSAYWTKEFCEKTLGVNLSYLNDLVYLCEDYDLWKLKNPKSRFLACLFYKYFGEKFHRRFFSGDTRFTPEEIAYLRKRKRDFKDIYENLDVYDMEKINACFVQCNQFHNDISHKLLDGEGYQIVFFRNPQTKKVSVRNSCPGVHIGNTLSKLNIGGGHKDAGGFFEPDIHALQHKLVLIENELYNNETSIRRK